MTKLECKKCGSTRFERLYERDCTTSYIMDTKDDSIKGNMEPDHPEVVWQCAECETDVMIKHEYESDDEYREDWGHLPNLFCSELEGRFKEQSKDWFDGD